MENEETLLDHRKLLEMYARRDVAHCRDAINRVSAFYGAVTFRQECVAR